MDTSCVALEAEAETTADLPVTPHDSERPEWELSEPESVDPYPTPLDPPPSG